MPDYVENLPWINIKNTCSPNVQVVIKSIAKAKTDLQLKWMKYVCRIM